MKNQWNKIILILFLPILTLITNVGISSNKKHDLIQEEIYNIDSNIGNISRFDFSPSIKNGAESNGSIEYNFNYQEDKYWYWDQKDFIKPIWKQTIQEKQPRWNIKPSGKWEETPKPPIVPNGNKLLVPDEGPPNPDRKWKLEQPNGDENTLDKSKWIIKKNWSKKYYLDREYQSNDSYWNWKWEYNGVWQNYVAPEWGYGWEKGYWPQMTQEYYFERNKEVWVDYTLESHNNMLDSGKKVINTSMGNGPSRPSSPSKPQIPWYDRFINKEPIWPSDELNGEKHDVTPSNNGKTFYGEGSTSIPFDSSILIPGFEYDFKYKLMYKDQFGDTKQYDDGKHSFYTSKSSPELNISYKNAGVPNNQSIMIDVESIDKQSTRVTPISYKLEEVSGSSAIIVDSGTFMSDNFSKTYGDLKLEKKYQFTAWFGYKTSYNKPTLIKETKIEDIKPIKILECQMILDIKGNLFKNIVIIEYLVDSHYHDFWKYLSEIKISVFDDNLLISEKIINLSTIKKGWNQILIEDSSFAKLNKLKLKLSVRSNYMDPETISKEIILIKNPGINIDHKIVLGNSITTKSSINIDYEIKNLSSSTNINWKTLEYKIKEKSSNWSEWISIDPKNSGTISNNDLKPNTEYLFELKAISDTGKKAFSNIYISKTNVEPKIEFSSPTTTTDSHTINFFVTNYKELINKNFEWEIINYESNLIERGKYTILHNEIHSLNFDMLSPNTQYEIGIKYNDNGKEKIWKNRFKTLGKSNISGSGYVTETGKKITYYNKLIVKTFGDIRTIQISDDNKNFIPATWTKEEKDLLYIDVNSLSNIDDVVYVKVNNTIVNKIRVNSDATIGVVRTNLNNWLPLILIIIFTILGIGLIILWGVINFKRYNKNKHLTNKEASNNIWFNAKEKINKIK